LIDDNPATKRDLKELGTSIRREIAGIRRDVKELEMRLTIRLGAIMAGGIVIVAALVKLL